MESYTIENYDSEGNLISTETLQRLDKSARLRAALIQIEAITSLADVKTFLRQLVRQLDAIIPEDRS